jgi:hypothetical protein
MFYVTSAVLLVGVFILIAGVVRSVTAILEHRREEAAPFRDYFGAEYDRDLLRLSSSSETEDWLEDRLPRFTPFRLRPLQLHSRRTAIGGTKRGTRELN